jgi:hypothetical protein
VGVPATPLFAQLGPLQNNGGPLAGAPTLAQTVPSEAPLPGSPVIDKGVNLPTLPATDERGLLRVINGTVDVGAVEFQPPATTTMVSTSGAVTFGQPLIFTAQVVAQVPGDPVTGTVTFSIDGTAEGSAPVVNGMATFTITPTASSLPTGNHALLATYNGDPNFTPSMATQTLTAPAQASPVTSTTLSVTGTAKYGQPLTFTAQVTAQVPGKPLTGMVTFSIDGTAVGTVTLVNGTAVLTFTPTPATLKPGDHTLTATYNGDTNYNTSAATQTLAGPMLPQLRTTVTRRHGRFTVQVFANGQFLQQFTLNAQPNIQTRDFDGDGINDLVISTRRGKKLVVLAAFSGATAARIA